MGDWKALPRTMHDDLLPEPDVHMMFGDEVLVQGKVPNSVLNQTQGDVLEQSNRPNADLRHFTQVRDVINMYRDSGVEEPVCQGGGNFQALRSCPHVLPVRCKWKFICGCFGNLAQIDPHNLREAHNTYLT
jgi:hypothetical protein